MGTRKPAAVTTAFVVALVGMLIAPAPVAAQTDDDAPPETRQPVESLEEELVEEEEEEEKPLAPGAPAKFGVGVRVRSVSLSEGMVEWFLEDAPAGISQVAWAFEVVRRKGNFDLVVALEYSKVEGTEGYYLEKGDVPSLPGQNPDYVTFDNFALLSADVSFLWHAPLHDKVSLRYGGGIGLGILMGKYTQQDTRCTSRDISSCSPDPGAGIETNKDKPPLLPIVNVLVGATFKPMDQLAVNLDLGFRDLLYIGIGTNYFF